MGPDEVAADRPGHLGGTGAGVAIDALSDEDTSGCVEVQGVEAHAALKATGAHDALLEESGGEALSLLQGREGANRVVSEDDGGL